MATIDDLPFLSTRNPQVRTDFVLYVQRESNRYQANFQGDLLLPEMRSGDAGKVLRVDSNGNPGWADPGSRVAAERLKYNAGGLQLDTSHAFTGGKFEDYAGFYLEYNGPYNANIHKAYTQVAAYSGVVGGKKMEARYRFPVPVRGWLTLYTLDQSTFIVSAGTEGNYSFPLGMEVYALWGLKRAF